MYSRFNKVLKYNLTILGHEKYKYTETTKRIRDFKRSIDGFINSFTFIKINILVIYNCKFYIKNGW